MSDVTRAHAVDPFVVLNNARPFDSDTNVLNKIVLGAKATQRQDAKLRELRDLGVTSSIATWAGECAEGRILILNSGTARSGYHIVTVYVGRDEWQWREGEAVTCGERTGNTHPLTGG